MQMTARGTPYPCSVPLAPIQLTQMEVKWAIVSESQSGAGCADQSQPASFRSKPPSANLICPFHSAHFLRAWTPSVFTELNIQTRDVRVCSSVHLLVRQEVKMHNAMIGTVFWHNFRSFFKALPISIHDKPSMTFV